MISQDSRMLETNSELLLIVISFLLSGLKKLIPTQHLRGCWDITFPAIIMSSFFLERYWKTTDSPFKALTFRLVSRSPNNVCVCDNCRKLVFRFNSFRLFFKLDSVVKQPQNTLVISFIYDFDGKSSLFLKKIAKYSRYSRKKRIF